MALQGSWVKNKCNLIPCSGIRTKLEGILTLYRRSIMDEKKQKKKDQLLLLHPPTEDLVHAVRVRDGEAPTPCIVKKMKEGANIPETCELVRVKPTDCPAVWESETYLELENGEVKGPAKVSTPAYRSGWERTFGSQSDDLPN